MNTTAAGHVVVAGGAGFLGSHLCDRLLTAGNLVTCVDDLSTGRIENVIHVAEHPHFRFIHGDVTAPDIIEQLGDEHCDVVMHLASPASPPEYLRRPIDTLDAGSLGTRYLLEVARTFDATFFLASTSEVYGDPEVHPQPESYWGNVNPVGARSVYDEAKRFAEALTMAYARTYDLDVRIVRIFNTYGPRMQPDDGRVITNFVNQAMRGEPLTIYGDGSQTRSFCYVDDEIDGFLALLRSDITEPVNIGNPNEFTMLELADVVREVTGSSSPIEYRVLPDDDPKVRRPDITIARERLGWEPTVDLREGLRRTMAWFAEQERTAGSKPDLVTQGRRPIVPIAPV